MADAAELLDEIELQCGDLQEAGDEPAVVELGRDEFEALRAQIDGDELELVQGRARRGRQAADEPKAGEPVAHYRLKVRQVDQASHLSVVAASDGA